MELLLSFLYILHCLPSPKPILQIVYTSLEQSVEIFHILLSYLRLGLSSFRWTVRSLMSKQTKGNNLNFHISERKFIYNSLYLYLIHINRVLEGHRLFCTMHFISYFYHIVESHIHPFPF